MSRIATVIFSCLLVVANAAANNALIEPEEAKNLALQQSDIFSEKRNFESEINEQPLVEFMSAYASSNQKHIEHVLKKVHKIVDSLKTTKIFYKTFQNFANQLRVVKDYLNVDDVDADAKQIYRIVNNEKNGKVDVLDVLAHHQDPESKCVTNASSVDLITQLYQSVAYAQVQALTVQLYTHNLLESITKKSHKNEADKLLKVFTEKMQQTHNHVNEAIKTASVEMEKCNNK